MSSTIVADERAAKLLEARAADLGVTVSELIAELARLEGESVASDAATIADLDRRWRRAAAGEGVLRRPWLSAGCVRGERHDLDRGLADGASGASPMKKATFDDLLASMNEALEHAEGKRTLRTTTLPRAPAPPGQTDAVGSAPAGDGSTCADQTRTALERRPSAVRNPDGTDSD